MVQRGVNRTFSACRNRWIRGRFEDKYRNKYTGLQVLTLQNQNAAKSVQSSPHAVSHTVAGIVLPPHAQNIQTSISTTQKVAATSWTLEEDEYMMKLMAELEDDGKTRPDAWRMIPALMLQRGYQRSLGAMRTRWSIHGYEKEYRNKSLGGQKPLADRGIPRLIPSRTKRALLANVLRRKVLGERVHGRGLSHSCRVLLTEQADSGLRPVKSWIGASHDILDVAWSPDGTRYVAGSAALTDANNLQYNRPNNLILGSLATNHVRELPDHRILRPEEASLMADPWLYTTVSAVHWSQSGRRVFSASYDETVKIWDVRNDERPECVTTIQHAAKVDVMAVAQDHVNLLATGTHKGARSLRAYYANTDGSRYTVLRLPAQQGTKGTFYDSPTCMRFGSTHSMSNWLAVGFGSDTLVNDLASVDGYLGVWRFDEDRLTEIRVSPRSHSIFDLAWSNNSSSFATANAIPPLMDGSRKMRSSIRVYSTNEQKMWVECFCPAIDINDVTICSHDWNYVSASCTDGKTYVWDMRRPDILLHQLAHGRPASELSRQAARELVDVGTRIALWGNNGGQFYTGGSDGVIKEWDLRRSPKDVLTGDVADLGIELMCGRFSPDKSNLLVGDAAGTLHILSKSPSAEEEPMEDIPFIRAPTEKLVAIDVVSSEDDESSLGKRAAQELLESGQIVIHPTYGPGQGQNYQGPYARWARQAGIEAENLATTPLLPEVQKTQRDQTRYGVKRPRILLRVSECQENGRRSKEPRIGTVDRSEAPENSVIGMRPQATSSNPTAEHTSTLHVESGKHSPTYKGTSGGMALWPPVDHSRMTPLVSRKPDTPPLPGLQPYVYKPQVDDAAPRMQDAENSTQSATNAAQATVITAPVQPAVQGQMPDRAPVSDQTSMLRPVLAETATARTGTHMSSPSSIRLSVSQARQRVQSPVTRIWPQAQSPAQTSVGTRDPVPVQVSTPLKASVSIQASPKVIDAASLSPPNPNHSGDLATTPSSSSRPASTPASASVQPTVFAKANTPAQAHTGPSTAPALSTIPTQSTAHHAPLQNARGTSQQPPQAHPPSTNALQPVALSSTSCNSCFFVHADCDGARPACGFCAKRGHPCFYPATSAETKQSTTTPVPMVPQSAVTNAYVFPNKSAVSALAPYWNQISGSGRQLCSSQTTISSHAQSHAPLQHSNRKLAQYTLEQATPRAGNSLTVLAHEHPAQTRGTGQLYKAVTDLQSAFTQNNLNRGTEAQAPVTKASASSEETSKNYPTTAPSRLSSAPLKESSPHTFISVKAAGPLLESSTKAADARVSRQPEFPITKLGGTISKSTPLGAENCLYGLNFVFTGILGTLKRAEGEHLIQRYGGRVTFAPDSQTSFVVVGKHAPRKRLDTVEMLGIKTIDEHGLFALIRKMPRNGGAAEGNGHAEKPSEPIATTAIAPTSFDLHSTTTANIHLPTNPPNTTQEVIVIPDDDMHDVHPVHVDLNNPYTSPSTVPESHSTNIETIAAHVQHDIDMADAAVDDVLNDRTADMQTNGMGSRTGGDEVEHEAHESDEDLEEEEDDDDDDFWFPPNWAVDANMTKEE